MEIIGLGVLVSKEQFDLSGQMSAEIMSKVCQELGWPTGEESRALSVQGRCQVLSVSEEEFQLITGAGYKNIARYLAKYILGIDENSKFNFKMKANFLAWEKEYSPWGKDVFACLWYS